MWPLLLGGLFVAICCIKSVCYVKSPLAAHSGAFYIKFHKTLSFSIYFELTTRDFTVEN